MRADFWETADGHKQQRNDKQQLDILAILSDPLFGMVGETVVYVTRTLPGVGDHKNVSQESSWIIFPLRVWTSKVPDDEVRVCFS